LSGHDTLAGVVFTTTVVAIITVFVLGRDANEKSDEEPEPAQEEPRTGKKRK